MTKAPFPMAYLRPTNWRLHTLRGHRKYLNPDERRRFLAAADRAAPELRAFCHVLAWTGFRLAEILTLASAHLPCRRRNCGDPKPEETWAKKKRGQGSVREVPVPDQLVGRLRQLVRPAGHAEFWD